MSMYHQSPRQCRSPYGERGLKFEALGHGLELGGRVALLTESVD